METAVSSDNDVVLQVHPGQVLVPGSRVDQADVEGNLPLQVELVERLRFTLLLGVRQLLFSLLLLRNSWGHLQGLLVVVQSRREQTQLVHGAPEVVVGLLALATKLEVGVEKRARLCREKKNSRKKARLIMASSRLGT